MSKAEMSNVAQKGSILVVDDEQRIADTLTLILRSQGYNVQVAYDGASGLEIYRTMVPDLVISDVVMPRMNGVDMAIAIRKEFPNARILLFSGQAVSADMLDEARGRGYDFELLAKPVHPNELLKKVNELIGPQVLRT